MLNTDNTSMLLWFSIHCISLLQGLQKMCQSIIHECFIYFSFKRNKYRFFARFWCNKQIANHNECTILVLYLYNCTYLVLFYLMESLDWNKTLAAVWRSRQEKLKAVRDIDLHQIDNLLCIDRQKSHFVANLENFLKGKPFNHVLLWGARGTGKSSLVKAALNAYHDQGLRVIEIPKDDLRWMIDITDTIRDLKQRFILFCDDLSFEEGETTYKELKSTLQGSIEKPPENVLIVATSNRKHLIPEKMKDNEQSTFVDGEIRHTDTIEEKMSLSDRFGLTLSFYPMNQKEYLKIVDHLFKNKKFGDKEQLHVLAARFARERGSMSGRIAKQFFNSWEVNSK